MKQIMMQQELIGKEIIRVEETYEETIFFFADNTYLVIHPYSVCDLSYIEIDHELSMYDKWHLDIIMQEEYDAYREKYKNAEKCRRKTQLEEMLSFKLILNWQTKKLTCTSCGTQQSVKYTRKGNPVCNKCVLL